MKSTKMSAFGNPSLVTGTRGELAIILNGQTQYLQFISYSDMCLFNPERCHLGITHTFRLKFLALKDNTYIISNCGDKKNSWGYDFYYKNRQLIFMVSTKKYIYSASVTYTKTDSLKEISDYELSWSAEEGASIHINGQLVTKKSLKIERTSTLMRNYSCIYSVGKKPGKSGSLANFRLEHWRVYFASRIILLKLGIIFGVYFHFISYFCNAHIDNYLMLNKNY